MNYRVIFISCALSPSLSPSLTSFLPAFAFAVHSIFVVVVIIAVAVALFARLPCNVLNVSDDALFSCQPHLLPLVHVPMPRPSRLRCRCCCCFLCIKIFMTTGCRHRPPSLPLPPLLGVACLAGCVACKAISRLTSSPCGHCGAT